jgi:hypothetical protein
MWDFFSATASVTTGRSIYELFSDHGRWHMVILQYMVILLFYWRGKTNDASQLPLNLNGLMTQLLTAQKGNWSVCGLKKKCPATVSDGFSIEQH